MNVEGNSPGQVSIGGSRFGRFAERKIRVQRARVRRRICKNGLRLGKGDLKIDGMKALTDVRLEDFNAFLKLVYAKTQRPAASWLWTVAVCIPIGIGSAAWVVKTGSSPDPRWTLFCAGFFAGFALFLLMGTLVARDQRKRMSPVEGGYILGPQEVEIETEGIRVKTVNHEALFRWPLIGPPEITEQHAFIMVDRIGGIIVPRRSFSSDAEWNGFIEAIQTRKLRNESYWMAAPARMKDEVKGRTEC